MDIGRANTGSYGDTYWAKTYETRFVVTLAKNLNGCVSNFHHYDNIPKKGNLTETNFVFLTILEVPIHCFWACGETVHHGQTAYLILGQETSRHQKVSGTSYIFARH